MKQGNLYLSFVFLFCLAGGYYCSKRFIEPVDLKKLTLEVNDNIRIADKRIQTEAEKIISEFHVNRTLPAAGSIFFLVRGNEVVSWNNHHFVPPVGFLDNNLNVIFLKTGAGDFLARKWKIDKEYTLVSLLPLHIEYKIKNKYLTPIWNEDIFDGKQVTLGEPESPGGYDIVLEGSIVCKVIGTNQKIIISEWGYGAVLFFVLAFTCMIPGLYKIHQYATSRNRDIGFLLVAAIIVAVRGAMIYSEFPSRFPDSVIFDPSVFASSELNPSLGDLFFNSIAVFILCMYLYRTHFRYSVIKSFFGAPVWIRWMVSIVSIVAVLFAMLFGYVVIQTIYNNSSITLSVSESLHFNSSRLLVLSSLVLCWVSCFLFIQVFIRLVMFNSDRIRVIVSVFFGATLFILINIFSGQYYFSSLVIGLAYVILVSQLKFFKGLQPFRYVTFLYIFSTVLAFSLNGVVAVQRHEMKRSVENQLRFAGNFLIERDNFAEYLLHESSVRIANDAFIKTRMTTPILGTEVIKQKITQFFLSGYFNRYTINIILFNSAGEPLESGSEFSFSDILSQYDKEANKTEYSNIYFLENEQGDFAKRYVLLVPLVNGEINSGFIVIELSLKRIIPENVYPELLVDSRFQHSKHASSLSYAIIDNDSIQYSSGVYNYQAIVSKKLKNAQLFTKGTVDDGYFHVAVSDSNSRLAIVSSPVRTWPQWFSDFSFLLVLGMVILLGFLLLRGGIDYSRFGNLYLATRIQLILNLAIFLPLVAVSILTLSVTSRTSLQQLQEEYLSKARKFGLSLTDMANQKNENDGFETNVTHMASLANLDVNLFSTNGRLEVSSHPLIFENNLLSPYLDQEVLQKIRNGSKSLISTEQVGNLKFYVAYSVLISPTSGEILGILGIPFFQTAASLDQLQINVFTTILSVFTLLFILLLFISFIVTKWLTSPLRLVTKTLSRISLTHENTPLEWKSEDEIGLMIKEYNLMLEKLRESKVQLEQKQRELAWREIAQQVAHEIKNPLTPMKLTLQQLERGLQSFKPEKAEKAVQSLLAQVNSLNDIASSFSSFAKMPEPVIAAVELNALLSKCINLHMHEGDLRFKSTVDQAITLGDEKLLLRIFDNIILNGIQAVNPGRDPEIEIRLDRMETMFQISFMDNGKGIDPLGAEKIFTPHFTTKQTGSGLGLAIARQGIEQMGGRIWFESSMNGTTFYIELQVAE